ncbi:MAG: tetratricopeptide repeat protein [Pseudomonadota bacterium]
MLLPRKKSYLALVLLLCCCGSGGAVKREAKLSRELFWIGEDHYRNKQPEAAKSELLRAIKMDPENAPAHDLLAMIYFAEGVHAQNYVEREQCLQGQEAQEQQSVVNERFRAAENHLLLAIKLSEGEKRNKSDALNTLANIALHFERYDDALAYSNGALENIMYPSRHMGLATRGWVHYRRGHLDEAAKDLRQALFYQPRFCAGRFRLAKVYYDQKKYELAIKNLEELITEPEKQKGWKGECCRVCDGECTCGDVCVPCGGECKEEVGCACKARGCQLQDAFHLLGLAYKRLKQQEQSQIQFEKCVMLNPKSCVAVQCRRYAKMIRR